MDKSVWLKNQFSWGDLYTVELRDYRQSVTPYPRYSVSVTWNASEDVPTRRLPVPVLNSVDLLTEMELLGRITDDVSSSNRISPVTALAAAATDARSGNAMAG